MSKPPYSFPVFEAAPGKIPVQFAPFRPTHPPQAQYQPGSYGPRQPNHGWTTAGGFGPPQPKHMQPPGLSHHYPLAHARPSPSPTNREQTERHAADVGNTKAIERLEKQVKNGQSCLEGLDAEVRALLELKARVDVLEAWVAHSRLRAIEDVREQSTRHESSPHKPTRARGRTRAALKPQWKRTRNGRLRSKVPTRKK